jgi:hypothetical protein
VNSTTDGCCGLGAGGGGSRTDGDGFVLSIIAVGGADSLSDGTRDSCN